MKRRPIAFLMMIMMMGLFMSSALANDAFFLVEAPANATREMIHQEGVTLLHSYIYNIRNDFFPKFPIYTYSHNPMTMRLQLVPIEHIQEGLRGSLFTFLRTIEFFSRFGNPAVEDNSHFPGYSYDIVSIVHASRDTGRIISKTLSRDAFKDSPIVTDFQDIKFYPLNDLLQIVQEEDWVDTIALMVVANIETRAVDIVGLVYDINKEFAFLVVKMNIFQ